MYPLTTNTTIYINAPAITDINAVIYFMDIAFKSYPFISLFLCMGVVLVGIMGFIFGKGLYERIFTKDVTK